MSGRQQKSITSRARPSVTPTLRSSPSARHITEEALTQILQLVVTRIKHRLKNDMEQKRNY